MYNQVSNIVPGEQQTLDNEKYVFFKNLVLHLLECKFHEGRNLCLFHSLIQVSSAVASI